MNIKKLKTNGFALFEGILLVVVIGVVVVIGLQVKKRISVLANTELAGQTPGIYCDDGVSGKRFQAVYVHAQYIMNNSTGVFNVPNNFTSAQATPIIKKSAAYAERTISQSAKKNNNGIRHLKWVLDSGCKLNIQNITVRDDEHDSIAELKAAGLNVTPNRKYVIFGDYPGRASTVFASDNVSLESYSYNGTNNWMQLGPFGVAHEIVHALGGREGSPDSNNYLPDRAAPHAARNSSHCTDWGDVMCYKDSESDAITTPCPDARSYSLLDCGNDDYFAVNPAAGSWLAQHPSRNGALSPFLATSGTVGQSNDFFLDRAVVPTSTNVVTVRGSNTGTIAEFNEPAHAGNVAKRSIWYEWRAPSTGYYTIKTYSSTVASSFDTVLGVYTGADSPIVGSKYGVPPVVSSAQLVGSNDNYDGRTGSRVRINVTSTSTKYKIVIDGKGGATGNTVLNIAKQ